MDNEANPGTNMFSGDSKERRKSIARCIGETLAEHLKQLDLSQNQFCDDFYRKLVDKDATSSDLEDHYGRFKKALKRNAEHSALYLFYLKGSFAFSDGFSLEDKNAAYQLYVELMTRVSSVSLEPTSGSDIAALNSIYSLFNSWRDICKEGGINTRYFLNHSKKYFDDSVRPLTTKWHEKVDKEKINSEFRSDLADFQKKTNFYIKSLEEDFKI